MSQLSLVTQLDPDPEQLWGSHIDTASTESETYALEVQGWALGRRLPVVAVEFVTAGTRPWQVSLDVQRADIAAKHPDVPGSELSGFRTSLNCIRLSRDFEVVVRAVMEDDARVDIGVLQGSRAAIESGFQGRLQPLMITTLARTGTTMLTRALSAHAQIVAYEPFTYEPAVAAYWFEILTSLSDPASHLLQLLPPLQRKELWWIGTQPRHRQRDLIDSQLQTWLGISSVDALATFCQSRISAVYEEIAKRTGHQSATYFAEKHWPNWIPGLMWELYPRARELIVVRDFRDMVSSILAFNEKRGFQSFGRGRVDTDQEFIESLGQPVSRLHHAWTTRADKAHLVRYEDLVRQPEETLAGILRYLDLDHDPSAVEAMLETLGEVGPEVQAHKTSRSSEDSIGRWRRDFSKDLEAASGAAFGPALADFGYSS